MTRKALRGFALFARRPLIVFSLVLAAVTVMRRARLFVLGLAVRIACAASCSWLRRCLACANFCQVRVRCDPACSVCACSACARSACACSAFARSACACANCSCSSSAKAGRSRQGQAPHELQGGIIRRRGSPLVDRAAGDVGDITPRLARQRAAVFKPLADAVWRRRYRPRRQSRGCRIAREARAVAVPRLGSPGADRTDHPAPFRRRPPA